MPRPPRAATETRWVTSAAVALVAAVLAACGGVSPDPVRMAEDIPDDDVRLDPIREVRLADAVEDAWQALGVGDTPRAEREARIALRLDPRNGPARAALAGALMARARAESPPDLALWRRAEGELKRAQKLAPGDRRVALQWVRFLVADGHRAAAAAAAEASLDAHPADPDLLRAAANLRYDLGDQTRARALLRRLVDVNPALPDAWFRLAQVEAGLAQRPGWALDASDGPSAAQRWRLAAAAFARYGDLVRHDPDARQGAGHAWLMAAAEERDAEDARQAHEKALEVYLDAKARWPQLAEFGVGAGRALAGLGRPDEAARVLHVTASGGEAVSAWLELLHLQAERGILVAAPGSPPGAVEIAERLLRDAPDNGLTTAEADGVRLWLEGSRSGDSGREDAPAGGDGARGTPSSSAGGPARQS